MRINEDHLCHVAALTQIAEYPTFKAINAFEPTKGERSRSAFSVNHDTGVYLKYATRPTKTFKEYVFTFSSANFDELAALKAHYHSRVFVVLVCHQAKEICVVTLDALEGHRADREKSNGAAEPHYQLLVTVPATKSFRVYMNAPGKKKTSLKQQIVSRNEFPRAVFNGTP
jgi:hypothetical protein